MFEKVLTRTYVWNIIVLVREMEIQKTAKRFKRCWRTFLLDCFTQYGRKYRKFILHILPIVVKTGKSIAFLHFKSIFTIKQRILIQGIRQAVRHSTLTAVFTSSNLVCPAITVHNFALSNNKHHQLSWLEQPAHNRSVVGSNPSWCIKN